MYYSSLNMLLSCATIIILLLIVFTSCNVNAIIIITIIIFHCINMIIKAMKIILCFFLRI